MHSHVYQTNPYVYVNSSIQEVENIVNYFIVQICLIMYFPITNFKLV